MRLKPRTKRILTLCSVLCIVILLSGCSMPRNEDGTIKLIELTTSFTETMKEENWFGAIFVWPLSQLINLIAPKIGVGGAIALVTIVVNTILLLATLKSTVATQQMQLIQPELEKIQRKYEGRTDDASKMKQASEMQALYKKHDINPAATLITTFLQFPVIMAMYMAVQRSYSVATGTFLNINLQNTPLNGIKALFAGDMTGLPYLLLFIVMGLCQFGSMMLPQYLTKKKLEAEAAKHHRRAEKPANQGKIMQIYMMGMIMVFGLMWPAAMSLYWAINSMVTIIKTIVVQKYIDSKTQKGTAR